MPAGWYASRSGTTWWRTDGSNRPEAGGNVAQKVSARRGVKSACACVLSEACVVSASLPPRKAAVNRDGNSN